MDSPSSSTFAEAGITLRVRVTVCGGAGAGARARAGAGAGRGAVAEPDAEPDFVGLGTSEPDSEPDFVGLGTGVGVEAATTGFLSPPETPATTAVPTPIATSAS